MEMLDHIGFDVSDYERSKAFYERALEPLGLKLLMEPVPGVGGSRLRRPHGSRSAALEAGGTDNGAPGIREIYHPDYYGAYVLDPDGNNVEAVCHKPV